MNMEMVNQKLKKLITRRSQSPDLLTSLSWSNKRGQRKMIKDLSLFLFRPLSLSMLQFCMIIQKTTKSCSIDKRFYKLSTAMTTAIVTLVILWKKLFS